MRIRLGVPEGLSREETKAALDAALETLTRAQEPLVARGRIPTARDAIASRRVRWRPEPPGDEHFDLAQTVLRRGWGDCDDLAPWHAASLRATGEDPEARAVVRPSGPRRWHAVVERSDGSIDDPSAAAGMGAVGADDYRGPLWPSMYGDRLSLAALPLTRGWAARIDLPSAEQPLAYSLLSRGATPRDAVVGACQVARYIDDACADDYARVAGIHDLLVGVPPREVAAALEHEEVGFGLSSLVPAATSLASPVLSKLLPSSSSSAERQPAMAAPAQGYPSGATMTCPGGPIIVRF
jgi:hypothetical protein